MTIIDRYIARQYLINVVILLVILCSFVVVVDVSLNLSRFVRAAGDRLAEAGVEDPGSLRQWAMTVIVISDLWWPRLAQLYNFILGFVLVAAMGFTCSQMSRHRELIALLGAGQSLRRVARPVLVVAGLLVMVQLVNQELVVPRIAPLLTRDHGDAGDHELATGEVPLTVDGAGRLFRAEEFNPDTGVLTDVTIWERGAGATPTRMIRATSASYREGGWDLTDGRAVLRGSEAGSAMGRSIGVSRVESGLGPADLRINRFAQFRNAVSFRQAGEILSRGKLLSTEQRARWARIRWGRVSASVSTLLTLVIALPFYLTREPKGLIAQSLRCAPITIFALMGGALGSSAGVPGVPAVVGVFVPVLILAPVAVGLWGTIKT